MLLASVCAGAAELDEQGRRALFEGGGIKQASEEDIASIMKDVNKSSEFAPQVTCKFPPKQGVTLGHTIDAAGKLKELEFTPSLGPVEIQIGTWSLGGELEGKTDVRVSGSAKTALEQGAVMSGSENPGGHPVRQQSW